MLQLLQQSYFITTFNIKFNHSYKNKRCLSLFYPTRRGFAFAVCNVRTMYKEKHPNFNIEYRRFQLRNGRVL
jgi:hypothetical protein